MSGRPWSAGSLLRLGSLLSFRGLIPRRRPLREALAREERLAYDAMVRAIVTHRGVVEFPLPVDVARAIDLPVKIALEMPQLFWCDGARVHYDPSAGAAVSAVLSYTVGEDDALRLLRLLRGAAAGLDGRASGDGVPLAAHDLLCRRVTYGGTGWRSHSAVGALVDGEAVCDGIARAYKLLCDLAGVDCLVATGWARGRGGTAGAWEPHAWNVVRSGGSRGHVDVTYDACLSAEVGGVRRDFFFLSDRQAAADRIPDEGRPLPACAGI